MSWPLLKSVVAKSGHPASKEPTFVCAGLEMSQKIGKGFAPSFMFKQMKQNPSKTNKQQKKPHTQEPKNPPEIKTRHHNLWASNVQKIFSGFKYICMDWFNCLWIHSAFCKMTTLINSLIVKSTEYTLIRKLNTANLNRVITIKIWNIIVLGSWHKSKGWASNQSWVLFLNNLRTFCPQFLFLKDKRTKVGST